MEHLPVWKVILLGIIQGATEFFPISSSGHLVIFQNLLGIAAKGKYLLTLDLALHFGTLGAVCYVFRRDLTGILVAAFWPRGFEKSGFEFSKEEARHLFVLLLLGTIPAAIIGGGFKSFFESLFVDVLPIGFFLAITGWILWKTQNVIHQGIGATTMSYKKALWVGLAQAVAILPGISRSGSTIAAGLYAGLRPEFAARFSFLLAVPAILGAVILEIGNFRHFAPQALVSTIIGVAVAFVVGVLCIRWLLRIISRGKLHYFSYYCWVVAGLAILSQLF